MQALVDTAPPCPGHMSDVDEQAPAGSQASYQVTLTADARAAEGIASLLEDAVEPQALAVSLFDRGGGRFEVSALYALPPSRDALIALGGAACCDLRIETLTPADWVTLSQGKRGPVHAGRFLVHGSHDRARVPKRRLSIEVDAGQAFGTAHHASTRGCLLAIDDLLKRSRPNVILDIGTGTGILAIAAAKAVRRKVFASDADPLAAGIAAANARNNCAGPLVSVVAAQGLAHPRLRQIEADLLLANLLERALYSLAPELARRVKPGGTAIISGLTQTQARGIEARTSAFGFILEKRIILDGWTTLMLKRRNARAVSD
jgi:ribosomal protein L11 methyltransferase